VPLDDYLATIIGVVRDDLITATSEYSLEAWAAPANVSQDDVSGIVSYCGSDTERNFTLGQSLYNYDFLNCSVLTSSYGLPGGCRGQCRTVGLEQQLCADVRC
jgi:hypothetical protein